MSRWWKWRICRILKMYTATSINSSTVTQTKVSQKFKMIWCRMSQLRIRPSLFKIHHLHKIKLQLFRSVSHRKWFIILVKNQSFPNWHSPWSIWLHSQLWERRSMLLRERCLTDWRKNQLTLILQLSQQLLRVLMLILGWHRVCKKLKNQTFICLTTFDI